MEEEIEVGFRLNGQGRTVRTDGGETSTTIQFEPTSVLTEFAVEYTTTCTESSSQSLLSGTYAKTAEHQQIILDELLYDCEIADCGLMPRTFWMPAKGMEPRCSLEQIALDIFHHHVGTASKNDGEHYYDPAKSGAEWWVQLRPSPDKQGRYAMHAPSDDDQDMAKEGISFHWDKDEDLRILCGGQTYVHPYLSTVTYLTDLGAPTLALNIRVHNLTGAYIMPTKTAHSSENDIATATSHERDSENNFEGFVSWPKTCKHFSFDGRFLHAAPPDLMKSGAFEKQCRIPRSDTNGKKRRDNGLQLKQLQRRHRRVTFLVNVWLNYKPFSVNSFPETMIDKLSGHKPGQPKVRINFPTNPQQQLKASAVIREVEVLGDTGLEVMSKNLMERFVWPLGDCDSGESISASLPLDIVREEAEQGGSIRIVWKDNNSVQICREMKGATPNKSEENESPSATNDREWDLTSTGSQTTKRPRLGITQPEFEAAYSGSRARNDYSE